METGLVGRFDSFSQEESERSAEGKRKEWGRKAAGVSRGRKAGEDSEDAEGVGGI